MRRMAKLALALSALTSACAAPGRDEPACVRGTGTHDGYFYTSWRDTDPAWGVRDLEAVCELAARHALTLERRVAMPANNQTLLFRRA